jgi:hypothetical protein
VSHCRRFASGNERTVYTWRRTHPEFAAEFEEARKWRAESRSDRIDDYIAQIAAGTLDPHAGRVMIDAERWLMSKESARYADKTVSEITGKDGGPIQLERDPIDAARRVSFMLGAALARVEQDKLIHAKLIRDKGNGRHRSEE